MGSTQSVSRKVNFEDIQYLLNKTNEYILINTLDKKDQDCLIKNTILIQDEEKTINHFMKNKIDIHINNPLSPLELLQSADGRLLGILIESIEII